MTMKIITIDKNSPYLEKVIQLSNENVATLGFLPTGAFHNLAANGQIFVALDENEDVLGYLLYGINRRESLAYITHLCIEQTQRRKGIARLLFDELKAATKHKFRGIRVRCRRDYEANVLWPKLGFHVFGEIPGRSKHGSTLTVWWFDYGQPTLFSYAAEKQAETSLKVVIDANIFYESDEPLTPDNQLSHALMSDWLDIELCLTNEIFTEINRQDNRAARNRAWNLANSRYPILSSPDDEVQRVSENLRDLFPPQMSESDESDLRQIAKTIASEVQFFVTRDGTLLKKSEQVYDRFGLRIIGPSDLIIRQDALMRDAEYQPSRLAGSLVNIQRVHSQQVNLLENHFREQDETKKKFRRQLQPYLADPHTFEVNVVRSEDQPLALIVYSRQSEDILEIPILRILKSSLSSTLARHLIFLAVSVSCKENRTLTTITDSRLSNDFNEALKETGFIFANHIWVKANIRAVAKTNSLTKQLVSLKGQFSQKTDRYFQQLLDVLEVAQKEQNSQSLLQIERFIWPAKIEDLDIPAYIVSIWPQWAMHLFDPNIAQQTLFGADPNLILNVENVYYRASRPVLEAPARILWYVSQRKGDFQGTMSIRACSYLDEVIVDTPKKLFSRFRRLGVYKWDDVYRVAKRNIAQEIMAFRFSGTELFNTPIHRNKLQEIWQREKKCNFNIQNPLRISNELFFKLYNIGSQF